MKTPKFLFALTLAVARFIPAAAAQTWETVDENPFPEAYASNGGALACAPDGSVYHLTSVIGDGVPTMRYVRRSTDQGATWTTVSAPPELVYKLAVDGANNLYLAGARYADGFWAVLKSVDGGQSWTTIFAGTSPSFSGVYGVMDLAVDERGAVYVVGDSQIYVPKARNVRSRWVVRKGEPTLTGAYTWSEVDTFSKEPTATALAYGIAIKPASAAGQPSEIYVGGEASDGWLIRRSLDRGVSWTTVDSLSSPSKNFNGLAIAPDASVYAVGFVTEGVTRKNPGTNYTIVRKGTPDASAPNGIRWSESSRIVRLGGAPTWFTARGMTVDGFGRVWLAGNGTGPSGAEFGWRVWASADGNAPYEFTDALTDGSSARSIASDSLGNIFVSGFYSNPETGRAAARVRRLLANP